MIESAVCNVVKEEAVRRAFPLEDEYKIALFMDGASLGRGTAKYDSLLEVTGRGYIQGGLKLQNIRYGLTHDRAWVTWDNPIWEEVSVTARGALIYNVSKDNMALCGIDFKENISSTNAPFIVELRPEFLGFGGSVVDDNNG